MQLAIHLAGCSVCRLFQRQSRWINRMVRDLFHYADSQEIRLNDEFKQQLQEKINERLK
jgi:predicted anti-sigma-YlaC factor YlaD